MHATPSPTLWGKMWKPALIVAAVGSLLLIVSAVAAVWRDLGDVGPALVYYTAVKGDLPIVVTERGNLESQQETIIRNQVESLSFDRNSGSSGSTILFIVPNGSQVESGDLLVELDSAQIRDRLESETLEWQSAKSQRSSI
jgi:multidrug efflux pump subunit AcrA (membrane-fusion protein)